MKRGCNGWSLVTALTCILVLHAASDKR